MNIKRIIKFTLIVLFTIIIIGVLGMLVWSKTGTYPARMVALSALESTDMVTITQDKWIIFEPNKETETGLIFYPGGLVEPTAYAPILHQIADKGVLVIITPMPLNLAILNTGAANAVKRERERERERERAYIQSSVTQAFVVKLSDMTSR